MKVNASTRPSALQDTSGTRNAVGRGTRIDRTSAQATVKSAIPEAQQFIRSKNRAISNASARPPSYIPLAPPDTSAPKNLQLKNKEVRFSNQVVEIPRQSEKPSLDKDTVRYAHQLFTKLSTTSQKKVRVEAGALSKVLSHAALFSDESDAKQLRKAIKLLKTRASDKDVDLRRFARTLTTAHQTLSRAELKHGREAEEQTLKALQSLMAAHNVSADRSSPDDWESDKRVEGSITTDAVQSEEDYGTVRIHADDTLALDGSGTTVIRSGDNTGGKPYLQESLDVAPWSVSPKNARGAIPPEWRTDKPSKPKQ